MPYSLVSAATLGFDLVRLPAGRSVAEVLLAGLTADAPALASVAAAHPGRGLSREERGVGEDVGRLAHQVAVQNSGGGVLGTQDVVPEQALEGGGVADRALLELGDEHGGPVSGTGGGVAHVRHGDGQFASAARADGENATLLPREAAGRVGGGDGGESLRIRAEPGEQDLGDRTARGKADQIEAQRGGTDQ